MEIFNFILFILKALKLEELLEVRNIREVAEKVAPMLGNNIVDVQLSLSTILNNFHSHKELFLNNFL